MLLQNNAKSFFGFAAAGEKPFPTAGQNQQK
jgi:hypothetical protein